MKQHPCALSSSTDSTESKASTSDETAATVQSPGAATNGAALKGFGAATGLGRGRNSRVSNSSPSKPFKSGSVRDSSDSESLAGASPAKAGSKGWGGAGAQSGDARPTYSRCVVVNGEPISDDRVAAAEQRAGPIQPGNYWYDQVSGFWGQMGGPCLGMIPPAIDLGPALPRNCSGGDTKVYVNARELHRKDLDRLVKRGLPLTDNMAYRVEANGNVFDGLSGEFLVNLGKLAPSLDNRKRGPGMRIPDQMPPSK
ncbi:unnamed protein product [Closterium sp. Yama58-4]|nr:unnamed protein product [Closterium sp. Yama58-4]